MPFIHGRQRGIISAGHGAHVFFLVVKCWCNGALLYISTMKNTQNTTTMGRKLQNTQRKSWQFETFRVTKTLREGQTKLGQDLELVMVHTHSRAGGAPIEVHMEIWLDGCGYHYLHPSTTLHEIEAAWNEALKEDALIMGAAY